MQRWKHQHVSIRNVLRQFGSTWMGTVTKSIVISRLLKTPLHYVQFCSLKWSGILTCFFTNILLMQHLKSWEEFHDNHPMLTGGSWKGGSSKPDQVIVPEKVKQREEKNLFSCVKNIMRRQEKRGTLFHSAPENEEARNWCQLCFISLSVKSLCHFFLHRKLLKKIHHCAHTLEKYKSHAYDWRPVALTPSLASVLRSSSETTSALCCLPHWTHYNLHTAETVPQTTLLPSPCTLLSPTWKIRTPM